ncbi:carbohydrate porin [Vibrio sp. SM6]|uniref:Carbohydrate porin n=1 Tax=Vibrio agarilyticus TaxID=2726741 RepID=A0A7X8YG44_9VIBR|nr:carbohydrate porin [Vibrio agarilyticus]NLS12190.1 carbohydrate porin [Vibrio agarilyticus]
MKNNKLLTLVSVAVSSVVASMAVNAAEVEFTGYARYGVDYQAEEAQYVQMGSMGRTLGRLGNELNGGEFQFSTSFEANEGQQWDIVLMIDNWAHSDWNSNGGIDLKKIYAGVKNVIPAQPDMYIWAGRDFHQRYTQSLNDYFWMTHDGQGAGFRNLTFDFAKLDMGFVEKVLTAEDGLSLGEGNGNYALTSKLHSIDVGYGILDLYANFGFASEKANKDDRENKAWQVAATMNIDGNYKAVLRYSDGADDSVLQRTDDLQVIYTSFEGRYNIGNPVSMEYMVSYKEFAGLDAKDWSNNGKLRDKEYAAIVRPMFTWNETFSTWLEAGYAVEEYNDGDETKGWKATLSQNITAGSMPWSRPTLRFYATVGDVDKPQGVKVDTLTLGAMFEAWW